MKIDSEDRFIDFDFAKITCGREITAQTGYGRYCVGRPLLEVMALSYAEVLQELGLKEEEERFILYLEWDALRSAIGQYLGTRDENIDTERCQITSIEHGEREIEIAMVILPPAELPKILPCGLSEKKGPQN